MITFESFKIKGKGGEYLVTGEYPMITVIYGMSRIFVFPYASFRNSVGVNDILYADWMLQEWEKGIAGP
jgi:hypothetical protein